MYNFKDILPIRVTLNMSESVTNTMETRRVCQQVHMFCVIEMPNDQVTGENCLESVELYLMFG